MELAHACVCVSVLAYVCVCVSMCVCRCVSMRLCITVTSVLNLGVSGCWLGREVAHTIENLGYFHRDDGNLRDFPSGSEIIRLPVPLNTPAHSNALLGFR